ncbi:MAG: exonuclease SbcCD subunit D, partial [Clostridiales bacterium]|nr:exonuclease SbcCD subunit D [Clostridiales bacterium]
MRILHTADWHLGKVIFSRSLLPEQEHFIHSWLPAFLDREKPDCIVLSGDVFDRPVAPADAIRLLDEAFSEIIVEREIPLLLITGNHDGAERLSLGASLLRKQGLYISCYPSDALSPVTLSDEQGEVQFWLLPFLTPPEIRALLEDDSLRGFADCYGALFRKIRSLQKPGVRQVLAAHCFVGGAQTSEGEAQVFVGTAGELPASLFDGFDYVALGHLHGAQRAGRDCVRYAGSPLKYSFDEVHQKKSVTLVDLTLSECRYELYDIQPLHDMRRIRGTLRQLLDAAAQDEHREDFVYASLQDEGPVFEPMQRLREYYPNILGMESGWLKSRTEDSERAQLRQQMKARQSSDELVFREFLRQLCGYEAQQ